MKFPNFVKMPGEPLYPVRAMAVTDAEALHRFCWPQGTLEGVCELLQRSQRQSDAQRTRALVALNKAQQPMAFGQIMRWPRAAEISDLIVAAEWRSHGIGSTLIGALIKEARCWPISEVEIGAALSNPRALALYRRLGFRDQRTLALDLGYGPEPVVYLTMTVPPD